MDWNALKNDGGKVFENLSGLDFLKQLKKCPPGSEQTFFNNLINVIADIQVLKRERQPSAPGPLRTNPPQSLFGSFSGVL